MMDSAASDTTVWVTLVGLANGAVVTTMFFSIVLLLFWYYTWRHQGNTPVGTPIGRFITCTCVSGLLFLLIFLIILILAFFDTMIALQCLLAPGMFCEGFSWIFFLLTIILLFVYVIWLIVSSRGVWRYWWYRRNNCPRIWSQLTASDSVEVLNDSGSLSSPTRFDRAESEASNLDSCTEENKDHNSEDFNSGNQDLSGLHSGGRGSRIPFFPLKQDSDSPPTLLDPISPDKVVHSVSAKLMPPNESIPLLTCGLISEPHLLEPHLSEPHLSEPHLSEPHLSEPHLSEPHLSEPHLSEPHLSEPHLSEPHLSESHLSEPHLSEPHLSEPHLHGFRLPELGQPEPLQPETQISEPCQPEPHLHEIHLFELGQPEPHQHKPRQPEPHLPHQKIGNPSTEFTYSLLGDDFPKHNIAQTCFVLGDVDTLTITHQGGTFPLHPFGPRGGEQQVECCATLEAPPGVVGSGVTVSVHYAIILDGPFKFPEEWERTSVVLYIDCPDSKLLIEPLTVNLHHWAVSSGTSRMCFMKSGHLLQKGQNEFTFKCHANAIPSQPNVASVYLKDHFCLVCVAATSDVMVTSRYYGILLSDPLKDRVEKFWLCITYAVPSWVQAVAEYYRRREGSEGCCEIPEYEEMQISYGNKVKIEIENQSGLGWSLSVTKKEALLRDVDSLSRYTSCTEKERAVRLGSYPPSVKFRVTYDTVPSPETHKPITKNACLLSESGDTISLSFMVQEEKATDPIVPSAAITDVNMPSNGHVQGSWTETTDSSQDDSNLGEPSKPLTVQHLMPYINDLADQVVSISGWLGMDGELSVIRRTFGMITPREQLQELLKKWLEDTERPTAPHTWEYFVGMVQGVRKGHVAEKIVEDVFTDSGLPSDPVALEKYVVSKMADNWYQFGIRLGLPEDILKAIDDSKLMIKNSARCLVMFQKWMEEIGPVENKMDKIEEAMKEVMKVTGDEKSGMTSMCGSEQGEASPISNDAIPPWVEKMADNWFNFGVALGFSEEDLQFIRDSNDDDVARCSAMMYRWLRTGDRREKTHERLLRAAKEATPPVATSGRYTEPPPYSESERVNPEVPQFKLV